ncbi:DUF2247 family protein [Lactiplantibacillus herbarum]|uniref:DUF2247 family protein n=1 Tax=Lactiplantibacillus herbarum TaxID=1670446 RepID=UPI000ABF5ADC|nr:DUF2247 family protein [Lactiplantibacillus herbarum]
MGIMKDELSEIYRNSQGKSLNTMFNEFVHYVNAHHHIFLRYATEEYLAVIERAQAKDYILGTADIDFERGFTYERNELEKSPFAKTICRQVNSIIFDMGIYRLSESCPACDYNLLLGSSVDHKRLMKCCEECAVVYAVPGNEAIRYQDKEEIVPANRWQVAAYLNQGITLTPYARLGINQEDKMALHDLQANHVNYNWQTIYVGVKEALFTSKSLTDYAVELMEAGSDDDWIIELAWGVVPDELQANLQQLKDCYFPNLQDNDAEYQLELRKLRFVALSQLNSRVRDVDELLLQIAYFYDNHGYPTDMVDFIYYMPSSEPPMTKRGLLARFRHFLALEKRKLNL